MEPRGDCRERILHCDAGSREPAPFIRTTLLLSIRASLYNFAMELRDDIAAKWQATSIATQTFFAEMSDSKFSAPRDGRWTFAQNLEHLILAVQPVARAMGLPKPLLRVLFGRATTTRTYAEIKAAYKAKLNAGTKAPRRFVPAPKSTRVELLQRWQGCSDRLAGKLSLWNDAQLTTLRLPHPILGKLSVAEMLFFTDLHVWHHLELCEAEHG